MDYEEEQALEFEALGAIFLDDYELLSPQVPRQVRLRLVPIPGEECASDNHVECRVVFTLPEKYPEELPGVEVVPVRGLTSKNCEELLTRANSEAESNLGLPMIFTIAESLKEWLLENNRDHTDESMHALMMAKEQAEEREKKAKEEAARRAKALAEDGMPQGAEEEKPREIHGTPVTRENFQEWYDKFLAELREKKEQEDAPLRTQSGSKAVAPDAHLTGRQYFEQRRTANEELAAQGNAEQVEEWDTEIQEDLFLEDDQELDDLDDLESDDDDSDEE